MTARILPPLTRSEADAERVARVVHEGQTDKAGRPYIEHVERVAERTRQLAAGHDLRGWTEDLAEQIAWLHDACEPDERPYGLFYPDDLEEEGFLPGMVDAVALYLTRRSEVTYLDYISEIASAAPLAILFVKLADLEDNSDPARLALLPQDKATSLLKRYEPAKARIRKALVNRFGVSL